MNTPICWFNSLYSRLPFLWSFLSMLPPDGQITTTHKSMYTPTLSHWSFHTKWMISALCVALSIGKIFHPCYISRPPCGSAASTCQADPPINQPWAILPSPSAGYMETHSPHPTLLLSPTIQLKVQARRETLVQLWWATWESGYLLMYVPCAFWLSFGSNSDVLFPTL